MAARAASLLLVCLAALRPPAAATLAASGPEEHATPSGPEEHATPSGPEDHAARSGPEDHALLISKCCPHDQQLNRNINGCAAYGGSRRDPSPLGGNDTVGLLRSRYGPFPWWMLNTTRLLNSADGRPATGLLTSPRAALGVRYAALPACGPDHWKYVSASKRDLYTMFTNGTLAITISNSDRRPLFYPYEYCADRVDVPNENIFVFLVCPCHKIVCIRKCCSGTKSLSPDPKDFCRKESSVSPWRPTFYSSGADANETVRPPHFLMTNSPVRCDQGYESVRLHKRSPTEDTTESFKIFPNGSASIDGWTRDAPLPSDQFCADWSFFPIDNTTVENIIFCWPRVQEYNVVSIVVFFLGALFYLLTFLVYVSQPELREGPGKKALICHSAMFFLGYLNLAIGLLRTRVGVVECHIKALTAQFFFIAGFFWMNVMCIEIFRTFSGIRVVPAIADQKFLFYSLYAWGCPVVLSLVTICMQYIDELPGLGPRIGDPFCWFGDFTSTLAYYYGPAALPLLLNVALFVAVAVQLGRVRCGRERRLDGSHKHITVALYIKLFLVMGLTWLTDVVSGFTMNKHASLASDVLNLLRAAAVFYVFCCTRDVWQQLCRRRRSREPDPASAKYTSMTLL